MNTLYQLAVLIICLLWNFIYKNIIICHKGIILARLKQLLHLVMLNDTWISGVSPDHHHHIHCIAHVLPCAFGPGPQVLMCDNIF